MGVSRFAAESYIRAEKRPPVEALERLSEAMRSRAEEMLRMVNPGGELDMLIRERKAAPPKRLGGFALRAREKKLARFEALAKRHGVEGEVAGGFEAPVRLGDGPKGGSRFP